MSKLKAALQALADQARANHIHRMPEMQVQANYVAKTLELLRWKDSDDGGVEAGGNGGLSRKTLNTNGKKYAPELGGIRIIL